jgi:ribosomal RNA assembly protein
VKRLEYSQAIEIPKQRVKVLLSSLKEIKRRTKTEIEISKEGSVEIKGESLDTWIALQVVKAIGRGFPAEKALLLLQEDHVFDLIYITDYARSKSSLQRLRGRVIGKEGKAKKNIEELTNTYIQIFGKTIGIIGEARDVELARRAVELLLRGAKHSTVYRMLERERRLRYG